MSLYVPPSKRTVKTTQSTNQAPSTCTRSSLPQDNRNFSGAYVPPSKRIINAARSANQASRTQASNTYNGGNFSGGYMSPERTYIGVNSQRVIVVQYNGKVYASVNTRWHGLIDPLMCTFNFIDNNIIRMYIEVGNASTMQIKLAYVHMDKVAETLLGC